MRLSPVRPLSGSFLEPDNAAEKMRLSHLNNTSLLAAQEKAALTAVLEGEAVTVRGVRLRGPKR